MSTNNAKRQRTQAPSQPEWDMHRRELEELYLVRDWTLKRIERHMFEHHEFKATPRMYKARFRKWKLRKYKSYEEMKAVKWAMQQPERLAFIGRPTAVSMEGREFTESEIDDYFRRRSEHTKRPPSSVTTPEQDLLEKLICLISPAVPDSTITEPPQPATSSLLPTTVANSPNITQSIIPWESSPTTLVRRPANSLSAVTPNITPAWPIYSQTDAPSYPLQESGGLWEHENALRHALNFCQEASTTEAFVNGYICWEETPWISLLCATCGHVDEDRKFAALRDLKRACLILEEKPADTLMNIGTLVGLCYWNLAFRSRGATHSEHFNTFLRHLYKASTKQFPSPNHPLSHLSRSLQNESSWALSGDIYLIMRQHLGKTIGSVHSAYFESMRQYAVSLRYSPQIPSLSLISSLSLEKVLESSIHHLGLWHPVTCGIRRELGSLLSRQSQYLPLYNLHYGFVYGEFFRNHHIIRGSDLTVAWNFAAAADHIGRTLEAENLYARIFLHLRAVKGDDESQTVQTAKESARFLEKRGKKEEAQPEIDVVAAFERHAREQCKEEWWVLRDMGFQRLLPPLEEMG